MDMTDVQQAQEHLAQLVARAARGEEIVITTAGKPVAKLVPYAASQEPRIPGGWEGKVFIAEDFDDIPPEIASAFGLDEDTETS